MHTVVLGLGSDVGVPVNHLDVAPEADNASVGGKTSEVGQVPIRANLNKGNTISLTDDTELAAAVLPTPDIVTLALFTQSH